MPREELMFDIDRIIKQAALEGTLTEDAIGYYNGLIKLAEEKKAECKALTERVERLDAERAALAGEKAQLQTAVHEWATRETELKDREEKVLRKEIEAEFNEKRVADHKEMFKVVFRNSVLRKEVMTPVDQPEPNQYNSCPPAGYPQKDTVEEEET